MTWLRRDRERGSASPRQLRAFSWLLAAVVASGCARRHEPGDAAAVGGRDAGESTRGVRRVDGGASADAGDAGIELRLDAVDAAPERDALDGGVGDAGVATSDAGDAGSDVAPLCVPEQCSVGDSADATLYWRGEWHRARACCYASEDPGAFEPSAPRDSCGIAIPDGYEFDAFYCVPFQEGVHDDTCLDTVVQGERVEGCRRSDGACGHLTPGWGCHEVYRAYWAWGLDDSWDLPNPFVCKQDGEPCWRGVECCAHPNYGGDCFPGSGPRDAGPDAAPGGCLSSEDFVEDSPLPFH